MKELEGCMKKFWKLSNELKKVEKIKEEVDRGEKELFNYSPKIFLSSVEEEKVSKPQPASEGPLDSYIV
jgi:hypothetical protein